MTPPSSSSAAFAASQLGWLQEIFWWSVVPPVVSIADVAIVVPKTPPPRFSRKSPWLESHKLSLLQKPIFIPLLSLTNSNPNLPCLPPPPPRQCWSGMLGGGGILIHNGKWNLTRSSKLAIATAINPKCTNSSVEMEKDILVEKDL